MKNLVRKISAVSHLEASVQNRRGSEQTLKHVAECAQSHAQYDVRNNVVGNVPVLQVRWIEVKCKRHG